jgi:hypothetical protein
MHSSRCGRELIAPSRVARTSSGGAAKGIVASDLPRAWQDPSAATADEHWHAARVRAARFQSFDEEDDEDPEDAEYELEDPYELDDVDFTLRDTIRGSLGLQLTDAAEAKRLVVGVEATQRVISTRQNTIGYRRDTAWRFERELKGEG